MDMHIFSWHFWRPRVAHTKMCPPSPHANKINLAVIIRNVPRLDIITTNDITETVLHHGGGQRTFDEVNLGKTPLSSTLSHFKRLLAVHLGDRLYEF